MPSKKDPKTATKDPMVLTPKQALEAGIGVTIRTHTGDTVDALAQPTAQMPPGSNPIVSQLVQDAVDLLQQQLRSGDPEVGLRASRAVLELIANLESASRYLTHTKPIPGIDHMVDRVYGGNDFDRGGVGPDPGIEVPLSDEEQRRIKAYTADI